MFQEVTAPSEKRKGRKKRTNVRNGESQTILGVSKQVGFRRPERLPGHSLWSRTLRLAQGSTVSELNALPGCESNGRGVASNRCCDIGRYRKRKAKVNASRPPLACARSGRDKRGLALPFAVSCPNSRFLPKLPKISCLNFSCMRALKNLPAIKRVEG